AFAQRINDLDEYVLEEVVGKLPVLGKHVDRRIDLGLVPVEQGREGGFVAGEVQVYKLLIIERLHLHTTRGFKLTMRRLSRLNQSEKQCSVVLREWIFISLNSVCSR